MTEAEGRALLLHAATEIVERTGSPNFTIREVAARAGINHGLVHRYFGTKDALVDAVIAEIEVSVAKDMAAEADIDALNSDGAATLARLIAHAMLSERTLSGGAAPVDIRPDANGGINGGAQRADPTPAPSPVADLLVRRCREASDMSEQDARVVAAQIMALAMGWRLNEEFLIRSCGLGDHRVDALRKELLESCMRLAGAHVGDDGAAVESRGRATANTP